MTLYVSSIMERKFGRLFCGALHLLLKNSKRQGKPDLNVLFNYNMPIRGYAENDKRAGDDGYGACAHGND